MFSKDSSRRENIQSNYRKKQDVDICNVSALWGISQLPFAAHPLQLWDVLGVQSLGKFPFSVPNRRLCWANLGIFVLRDPKGSPWPNQHQQKTGKSSFLKAKVAFSPWNFPKPRNSWDQRNGWEQELPPEHWAHTSTSLQVMDHFILLHTWKESQGIVEKYSFIPP